MTQSKNPHSDRARHRGRLRVSSPARHRGVSPHDCAALVGREKYDPPRLMEGGQETISTSFSPHRSTRREDDPAAGRHLLRFGTIASVLQLLSFPTAPVKVRRGGQGVRALTNIVPNEEYYEARLTAAAQGGGRPDRARSACAALCSMSSKAMSSSTRRLPGSRWAAVSRSRIRAKALRDTVAFASRGEGVGEAGDPGACPTVAERLERVLGQMESVDLRSAGREADPHPRASASKCEKTQSRVLSE